MDKNISLTPYKILEEAAECLKMLSHPYRLRIIEVLSQKEVTVGELADLCDLTQPATSEHLRLLKNKGLLNKKRDARKIYYSIADDHLLNILSCIQNRYGRGEK